MAVDIKVQCIRVSISLSYIGRYVSSRKSEVRRRVLYFWRLHLCGKKYVRRSVKAVRRNFVRSHWQIQGEGCGVAPPPPLVGNFTKNVIFCHLEVVSPPFRTECCTSRERLNPSPFPLIRFQIRLWK